MRRLAFLLLAALALPPLAPAFAAGGSDAALAEAPVARDDYASLQRGAAVFMNYCSGCHSAAYVRYGRLASDLGIPEAQLRAHLMPASAGLADGIASAMPPEQAVEWFHQAAPPDLSLSAKLRGVDWLYGYLRGFYLDPSRPGGWNNAVFPNVAMPHVLAGLQGEYALDGGGDGEKTLRRAGRLSASEYDALAADLVNFMDYMADPSRAERHRAGYVILSVLMLLFVCTYFLYREYWRDIR